MGEKDGRDRATKGETMQNIARGEHPKFVVVGHPNKGKSSIVSSLSFDDTIQIADTPGTTTIKRSFPFVVDGKTLYEIYDTPGFQRPRRVLSWLQSHDVSADKRADVVREFIETFRDDERYIDEIELLTPIMQGAGIIYVVDGSKPYGEEYEMEMEILRWTGEPSMALINLIDITSYEEQWRKALGQYFKLVRVYNPMSRTFDDHIQLLSAIAQLREEWVTPLTKAIDITIQNREQRFQKTAQSIADMMQDILTHTQKISISSYDNTESKRELLVERYREYIKQREKRAQKQIESIWNHNHLQKEQTPIPFIDIDLFSSQSESIFGLTKQKLITTGVASGAAVGASADLLTAGSTLFLGSAIGAIVGGVGAYMGFGKIFDTKLMGRKLGKRYLQIGPLQEPNFTYILLGRAIYYSSTIISRSHAMRGKLKIEVGEEFQDIWLNKETTPIIAKYHKLLTKDNKMHNEEKVEYIDTLSLILKRLSF